jgi:hypothetical protein
MRTVKPKYNPSLAQLPRSASLDILYYIDDCSDWWREICIDFGQCLRREVTEVCCCWTLSG